jgi:tetratricopeptide (TPR) repeat protein
MLAMRGQITAKIREGLIPALGASNGVEDAKSGAKNAEAYDLYLRSVAKSSDAGPNREAIASLERAVGLDPGYAQAWSALGERYHYEFAYGGLDPKMIERSNSALQRALALDPNLIVAADNLILQLVERNKLTEAYKEAKASVARHPENADVHFALSYVLRYGGAIEESARECDSALSLDRGNPTFRSCIFTFRQLGNYAHALDFLQADSGSLWTETNRTRILLLQGKKDEAMNVAGRIPNSSYSANLVSCLEKPATPAATKRTQEFVDRSLADPDPEPAFWIAGDAILCGRKDLAMHLMKYSVDGGYCGYTGLKNDRAYEPLAAIPEFNDLLSKSKSCQDTFRAEMAKTGS